MDKLDTGLLINPAHIKLYRRYFQQMCDLHGLKVLYRAPREGKTYNNEGELDTFFYEPIITGCIFDEFPTERTMKKLGWATELDKGNSIIHVPYDLVKLQDGALFIIPSALDKAEGRLFRVIDMSTISIYPASIACEIGPVWKNTFEKSQHDHHDNNFNLLADDDEDD